MEKTLSRRSAVSGAIALGATVASPRALLAGLSELPLDPLDPEENVEAIVRIIGSASGQRTYYWNSGRIFGQKSGSVARPLFQFEAIGSSVFTRLAEHHYRRENISILVFKDLETGRTLDRWRNPYTDEVVSPEFMYGGPLAVVLTPHGQVLEEAFADKSYLGRSPLLWDWRTSGNTVWVTRDVLSEESYRSRNEGVDESLDLNYILTEFQTYQTTLSELSNTSLPSVTSTMTMTARFGWHPWMHMGEIDGDLIWHSSGRKIEKVSDLPQAFVQECESLWPNSILAPDRAVRGNASAE